MGLQLNDRKHSGRREGQWFEPNDLLPKNEMIVPVIMAGGSGTRLWPLSRAKHPKQFLPLNSDKTMLQETVQRIRGLSTSESVTICNEEHRFFVAEQLREIESLGKIIVEPAGRNTAPTIALAAL